MKEHNDKRIYLNDYIIVAKNDTIIRVFFGMIIILFEFLTKIYIDFYLKIFIFLLVIIYCIYYFNIYTRLQNIKKFLIKKKIIVDDLYIFFWNEKNVLFTSFGIIINIKKTISIINYDDISLISIKDHYFNRRKPGKDLILTLKNKSVYQFLIYDYLFCNVDYTKISEFLKLKNPNINQNL